MPKKLFIPSVVRGKTHTALMKGRRETIYKMLSRKHDGVVPCFVCNKHVEKKDATLEHILEKSKGGTDEMDNLSISHGLCNNERSKK